MPAPKVLVYDASGSGPNGALLGAAWWLSSRLVGRFDVKIGARNPEEMAQKLSQAITDHGPLGSITMWSHGRPALPLLGGYPVTVDHLRVVKRFAHPLRYLWFRGCRIFGGRAGQAFASELASALNCGVIGHTRVVSGDEDGDPVPNSILWQSGCYGLRPGQAPYWSPDDRGGSERGAPNTVSVFEHTPPGWVWWTPSP